MKMFRDYFQLRNLLGKDILRMLSFAVIVGFVLFFADIMFIYTLQAFLKEIGIASADGVSIPSFFPEGFIPCLFLLLFVGVTRVVALMTKSYLGGVVNQNFLRIQRERLFSYAIFKSTSTSSHEVMNVFTDVLSRVGSAILDLTGVFITLSTVTFLFFSGLYLAPKEMLLGVVLGGCLLYPTRRLNHYVNQSGKGLSDEWRNTTKLLMEGTKHNYFFFAHGLIDALIRKGHCSIKSYERYYKKFFALSALKNGTPNIAGILLLSVISYLSIKYFHTKGAVLLSFLYLFIRLSQGIGELFVVFSHLRLNISSVEGLLSWDKKVSSFFSTYKPRDPCSSSLVKLDTICFDFKNVSFGFSPDEMIIDKLDLSVGNGDTLIVKGESGVGKSTLISLFMGINSPLQGQVLMNNGSINSRFYDFKNSLAYVGPEPYLFEGTIRENLLFGHPNPDPITDDKIHDAIASTELTSFVNNLKDGIHHKFEEHADASTGQKQRLSLCRAFLRSPSLLILDEATANLDPDTEIQIMDKIQPLMENMTTIIITHKDNLVPYGNMVLELKKKSQFSLRTQAES